jgi:hypothetical protein
MEKMQNKQNPIIAQKKEAQNTNNMELNGFWQTRYDTETPLLINSLEHPELK